MNTVIKVILSLLDGLLGQFLGAFLTNWEANHAGDNQILDMVAQLVAAAQTDPALTTSDAKYQYVFDTAMADLKGMGKNIAASMLNTLIELAVQQLQAKVGG